jgi:hypothetical protein
MIKVNDPKGVAGSLKAPMWLVPPVALEELSWVLKLGAEKYGEYNWRKTGVCASTYISAAFRHLNAWRDGEDLDPESGRSHLAHAMTCFAIVLDAEKCGTLDDDRNKLPAIADANRTYYAPDIVPTSPVSLKALAEMKGALSAKKCGTPTPKAEEDTLTFAMGPDDEIIQYSIPEGWVFDADAPKYDFTGERVVEIPDGLPPLPDPPEGYKWVGRGYGWRNKSCVHTYYSCSGGAWVNPRVVFRGKEILKTGEAGGHIDRFYVEAVKIEDGECYCGYRIVRDHNGNAICENCENCYNCYNL